MDLFTLQYKKSEKLRRSPLISVVYRLRLHRVVKIELKRILDSRFRRTHRLRGNTICNNAQWNLGERASALCE